MRTIAVSKSRLSVVLMLVAAFAGFGESKAHATNGIETIPVGEYATAVDKDGNEVKVQYQRGTRAELAKLRPSELRAQGRAMRAQLVANCAAAEAGRPKIPGVGFAKDFLVEASLFTIAVGLSAGQQMDEDPAYARHFVEQSVVDPLAHASFAGFMIANRGAASFFQMMDWSHDPCVILKRKPGAGAMRLTPTLGQSKFRFIAGPLSMSAGLIVSSLMHQVLADPNVQKCAAFLIGKTAHRKNNAGGAVDKKPLENSLAEGDQACDVAYDEWILNGGHKIYELIPDMISMGIVSGLLAKVGEIKHGLAISTEALATRAAQTAVVEEALGSTSLRFTMSLSNKAIVFRGLSLVMNFGQAAPNPFVKAVCFVVNTVVFLKLQEAILPYIKEPFDQFSSAADIGSAMASINAEINQLQKDGWVYRAKPKPLKCSAPLARYSTNEWATVRPSECFTAAPNPGELIARMGKLQSKWREMLLTKTTAGISNWQDYVLRYVSTYLNAQKFYRDILLNISSHDRPSLKQQPGYPFLYIQEPLLNVRYNPADWQDFGSLCALPKANVTMFRDAIKKIDAWMAAKGLTNAFSKEEFDKFHLRDDGTITYTDTSVAASYNGRGGEPLPTKAMLLNLIRYGLYPVAIDCNTKLSDEPANATQSQKEAIRLARFRMAIAAIRWQLEGRPQRANFEASVKSATTAYSLPNPSTTATDDRAYVDTPEYLKYASVDIFAMVNYILGGAGVYPDGAGYVLGLNYEPTVISLEHKAEHAVTIGNVDTRLMSDYLLTSMVCGPQPSQTTVERNVNIGYTTVGWDVQFLPPKIVSGLAIDPCKDRASVSAAFFQPKIDGEVIAGLDIHRTQWSIAGKKYNGLLDIVKKHADPAAMGPDTDNFGFDRWWQATTDTRSTAVMKMYRDQFIAEVLQRNFWPLLLKGDYNDIKQPSINPMIEGPIAGFRVLWYNIRKGLKWVATEKTMALGLANAVMESSYDNFDILAPIFSGATEDEAKRFTAIRERINLHLHMGLEMVGPQHVLVHGLTAYTQKFGMPQEARDAQLAKQAVNKNDTKVTQALDPVAFAFFKANQEGLKSALEVLNKFMEKKLSTMQPGQKQMLTPIVAAVIKNLEGLMAEVEDYHGKVSSVRLDVAG